MLLEKFRFEIPSFLSRSQDEIALEEILNEIIINEAQSGKRAKMVSFSLTESQRHLCAQLKQYTLPLKYLLFTLDNAQR